MEDWSLSHSAIGASTESPPENRTPLCGLRARCITRQCLRGVLRLQVKSPLHHAAMLARSTNSQSAWEDSNLRPPVYQTGSWPAQLQTERVRLELTRPLWPGGFRDRVLIQPGPLQIRWDGFEPPPRDSQPRALPSELRTWHGVRRSRTFAAFRPRRASSPVPCHSAITPEGASGRIRPDTLPLTRRVLCR